MAKRKDRGLRRGQGYTERRTDKDGTVYYVARWPEGGRYPSKVFRDPDPDVALEAAEQHVRDMARRLRSGRTVPRSDLMVIDIVNQYLARGESRWSPNTYATYCQKTRGCIEKQIGKVRILDLDTARVQHWVDDLTRAKWSPSTIANAYLVLSGALKEAVRLGVLPTNPALGVKRPRIERTRHTTWTAEQIGPVFGEVANDPMWHALYRLTLMTGMRPGEVRALKWTDLNLDDATVTVRRTMTKDRDGRPVLGQDTKTDQPRQIALPASTIRALRSWSVEQKRKRLATTGWVDHGAVFTGRRGVHLSLMSWQQYHVRMCVRIQATLPEGEVFPVPTLHELRHTAATLMLNNRIPIKVVSDILGHKKIETTLNIYQHVSADMQRTATDAMEALLDATTWSPETPQNEAESG